MPVTDGVRAVEVGEDRTLLAVERTIPAPAAGQVLLDVAYCGICGSDLNFLPVPELYPAGTVPGHEISGCISVLGPGVSGWSVGDRVTVLPFAQCGECDRCRAGHEQLCPQGVANGVGLGTGRAGGYAQQVIVDATMLFALPDEVDDRAGALVEPLAVAVHAVARADVDPSEPVVVLGAGTIGLMTGLALREAGCERFVVVSRNPARTARAGALGLPVVSLSDKEAITAALGAEPACVLECAGSPAAARLGVDMLVPRGRMILVGIAMAPLDLAAAPIVLKEIEVKGALAYGRADFARAIELLASGAVAADDVVTGIGRLDEAQDMFRALLGPGNAHLKVLLEP
jgi:2-desacetyl-2-hydroxyethyl bacteriochlorophyllide A dehydrogenase